MGHGNFDEVREPTKVAGLSDIVKIDCGAEFTMALDKNGRLLVFGSNSYGQLGITMKTTKVN